MAGVPCVLDAAVEEVGVVLGDPLRALLEVVLQEVLRRPVAQTAHVHSQIAVYVWHRRLDRTIDSRKTRPADTTAVVAGS